MKKFTKTLLALLLVTFVMHTSLRAQSKDLENVLEIELKNSVAIKNNKTIGGYALFYNVDKMKKSNMYRLEVLDENLKSIGSNEFEGSKKLQMTDAVYESDHIMLSFTDPAKEEGTYKFVKTFDLKGKQTGLVTYEPESGRKGMFGKAAAESAGNYYNGFSNVEGKGFVVVNQQELKTGGADVQMISETGKMKWEKSFTADKGDRMDMYLTTTTANTLLFFVGERESIMKKESKNFLVGLDVATGKQIFKKSLEIKGFAWEPQFFKTTADGKLMMVSILTNENDKFYTARPLGFSIATVDDKTGEIVPEKNFLLGTELAAVMDMKSDTKSEDGYLQIHDVIPMLDGSKVVVGEFFRRTVSGGALAANVALAALGGGHAGSSTQISIGDGFLLRLDKNDKATSLERLEKKTTRELTPADGLSLGLLQRYFKMNGAFGYLYTDENQESGAKTVLFRGTFEGERYGTNAVTFDEKKGVKIKRLTVDAKGKDQVRIMKAKPGHVMISKYNKKDKKLTLSLERVD